MSARQLSARAAAKVNLGLEVLGRRPDGYHEVVTVLQAISLADRFVWRVTGQPFTYTGPQGVPPDADLVARALSFAPDRERWTGDLRVVKWVPAAAGLGGGSSDAALALRLALPEADEATLAAHAARLGSDVPFFLGPSGRALATGTGTTLEPLPDIDCWFVLVTPDVQIDGKTVALYRGLQPEDFSDGAATRALAVEMSEGNCWPTEIPNAFQRQLLGIPEVRYAYDCLWQAGASCVTASGAGPTLYALVATLAEAAAIALRMPPDAGATRVARSMGAPDLVAATRVARALRGTGNEPPEVGWWSNSRRC